MKMNICWWVGSPIEHNKRVKLYRAWRKQRNKVARQQRRRNRQHG